MKSFDKIPHRAWYFLLCYLAYSSYTFDFVLREAIRPKLMILYHLGTSEIDPYYKIVYLGLMVGVIIFGCLVNIINYRTCFIWVWILQSLGLLKLLSLSPFIVNTPLIHQLKSGMLLMGIAEGGIFAIIHPLITLMFNDPVESKTKIMNYLHTSWPLFVLLGFLFETTVLTWHLDWYWNIYTMIFLSSFYFVIAMFLPLPIQTAAHHTPLSIRLQSIVRPGYVLLIFCMLFSFVVQFSPVVWIKHWLEVDLKINPLTLLLLMNGTQIVSRLSIGPILKQISPPGLLILATLLSILSLYLLSISTQRELILCVTGLFAISVAWYWPTYMGIVADRYPLSGGVGMGLINFSGFWVMRNIIPDVTTFQKIESLQDAFLDLAYLGGFGFVLLVAVYMSFRLQEGYKVLTTYDRSF